MLAAETELQRAEKVKNYLLQHKLLHPDYLLVKEMGLIYFPLVKKTKVPGAKVVETTFSFPTRKKTPSFVELLKHKLNKEELELIPKSQEIVGKILILEIPPKLEKKEKIIAEAYLKAHRNIETVVKKERMHEGIFRTRKVKILAGKLTKETIHLESGVQLKLHLEKTYFSARLGHERLRIVQQIKKGEEVLVMFSGAGPYPLVLARNSSAKKIIGVEVNPWAHYYGQQNVMLNKLEQKVTLIHGDVREVLPDLKYKFDRIVMPLPKTGEEFLDVALPKIKVGGVVHLYAFLKEEEIKAYGEKVKLICSRLKHPIKILRTALCGQFSPRTFRVCFDLKVLK